MQHPEHQSIEPQKNPDFQQFQLAQQRLLDLSAYMPEDLRPSSEQVASVILCTPEQFYQLHYDHMLEQGATEFAAKAQADASAYQHAKYFNRTGKIAIASKYETTQYSSSEQMESKERYYLLGLSHEFGHSFNPQVVHVSGEYAAQTLMISEDELENVLVYKLEQDPEIIISFLSDQLNMSSEEVYEKFDQAIDLETVLQENGLDSTDLDRYLLTKARQDVQFDIHGRRVSFVEKSTGRVIETLTAAYDRVLAEIQADTFMHYVLFLDFVDRQQISEQLAPEHMRELLSLYMQSSEFKNLLGANHLTAIYIGEAAKTFGGFEPLLHRFHEAQRNKSRENQTKLKDEETGSIKAIVNAGQAQEVVSFYYNRVAEENEFAKRVVPEVLQIMQNRFAKDITAVSELNRIRALIFVGQLNQAMQLLLKTFGEFGYVEDLLTVVKPLAIQESKMQKGSTLKDVAKGIDGDRRQGTVDVSVTLDREPDVIKIVRETMNQRAEKSTQNILASTAVVVAHVRARSHLVTHR